MNQKAMYNLTYGLFVVCASENDFYNGCIVNTAMQVTSSPNRIAITVNKQNKTHDMIMATGKFNVSMLSIDASFALFQHFGFQSGKTVNKFSDFHNYKVSENGIPYITEGTNAYLSGAVVQTFDLGTHTMFIADVVEGEVLNEVESITYTYYQKNIKPAPEQSQQSSGQWVCEICGYVYEKDDLPADFICPICKHGAEDFKRI